MEVEKARSKKSRAARNRPTFPHVFSMSRASLTNDMATDQEKGGDMSGEDTEIQEQRPVE